MRTKNRPWFLRRSLHDIAAQDFADWHVHIVNDGGDAAAVDAVVGGAAAAARRRGSQSATTPCRLGGPRPRIRACAACRPSSSCFTTTTTSGIHRSCRTTARHLDRHPDDIGVMVRTEIVYEKEGADGFEETGRAPFWPGLHDITYSDLLQVNRAVPISYLYRRALHDEVGYYREDLHAVEDWEFNLRTTLRHHIGFIDGEPLAYWMQRAGVGGELGNSMFALSDEHDRYERLVRDEALRAYVLENGPGLPLYLLEVHPGRSRSTARRSSIAGSASDRTLCATGGAIVGSDERGPVDHDRWTTANRVVLPEAKDV